MRLMGWTITFWTLLRAEDMAALRAVRCDAHARCGARNNLARQPETPVRAMPPGYDYIPGQALDVVVVLGLVAELGAQLLLVLEELLHLRPE